MQYGQQADLGAQVLGILGNAPESFRRRPKQDAVDDLFVLQGDGCDRARTP
jgi:hypothetical protein